MNTFEKIWDNIVIALSREKYITDAAINLWINPLKFIKFENNTFYLSAIDPITRNIVMEQFSTKIKNCAENVIGFSVDLTLLLNSEIENGFETAVETVTETKPDEEKKDESKPLEIFTFENFIKGKSNEFAYNAALAVSDNPGTKYNPLFIWGRSGVGKTHLSNAIANRISKTYPNYKIRCLSGEMFTNEFITCIKNKTNHEFRKNYRECDVLLLDDIQFLANKEGTLEEFFHTFNALKEAGKQIILTSDVAPRELKRLPDRLVSRFEEGIIVDIGAPDFETRVAIIKQKADDLNLEISHEMACYIAENIQKNIRRIQGIVKKIKMFCETTGTNGVNKSNIQTFIDRLSSEKPSIEKRIENIIREVSRVYSITVSDIKSEKRNANIVLARQVAIYAASKLTTLTQVEIGSFFGNKDHSTIIYALKTLEKKMQSDQSLESTVNAIIDNLSN